MTFDQAENAFRELHARVRSGQVMSRTEYERRTQDLALADQSGTTREIHPRSSQWMFFDGSDWQPGIPPGRVQSVVVLPPELPAAQPEQLASPESLAAPRTMELPRLVDLPMAPMRAPLAETLNPPPPPALVESPPPMQMAGPEAVPWAPESPEHSAVPISQIGRAHV
jgi:hypothetical protein